jgi:hypothetical protein
MVQIIAASPAGVDDGRIPNRWGFDLHRARERRDGDRTKTEGANGSARSARGVAGAISAMFTPRGANILDGPEVWSLHGQLSNRLDNSIPGARGNWWNDLLPSARR